MARDYAKIIGALLANAEDDAQSAEARAAYRAKAEDMMREYRVAEEVALAKDSTAAVPVLDLLDIMEHSALSNPLHNYYWQIWSEVAQHCGVRTLGMRKSLPGYDMKLVASIVGYAGDIAYAKMLWTSARLVFLTRIDASVDRSLSDQENCYYMRASGMSRKDIAMALWGSEPTDGAAHGKVQKLYVAECTKREETPKVSGRGIQVDLYRESYARGFVNELGWRLRAARDASDAASGGALVMHDRSGRVDEAFYREFPKQRPMSAEARAAQEARDEEYWALLEKERAECVKCAAAKTKCREHADRVLSAADRRRYERRIHSSEAEAGMRAGAASARTVDVARSGTPRANVAERGEARKELA